MLAGRQSAARGFARLVRVEPSHSSAGCPSTLSVGDLLTPGAGSGWAVSPRKGAPFLARLRTIKPGFFTNEYLADAGAEAMVLFAGLWCIADREGRVEDRPARIKVECIPYFNVDPNEQLQRLHDRGFIIRYEADGFKYIQINAFLKHQTPHVKEKSSTIPAPDKNSAFPVVAPERASTSTPSICLLSLGSGNLGLGSENLDPERKPRGGARGRVRKVEAPVPPDPRKDHPAIVAFRNETSRFPPKTWWDDIIRAVGDPPSPLLHDAFREWTRRGNKTSDLGWIAWVEAGEVPLNGGGTSKRNKGEMIAEAIAMYDKSKGLKNGE